jgi:hypothetical protein
MTCVDAAVEPPVTFDEATAVYDCVHAAVASVVFRGQLLLSVHVGSGQDDADREGPMYR